MSDADPGADRPGSPADGSRRLRIAVVGSGISGLGAASMLCRRHDVTVFEKEGRIGGHSCTVDAETPEGTVPVDMGFIVYNDRNYPLLTELFSRLQVPVANSDMSFGVSADGGGLEYGTRSPMGLVAQPGNLARPAFLGMLRDILRFNRMARGFVERRPDASLAECLDGLRMGDWFRRHYLLAMAGAIWSSPPSGMLDFPARTLVGFFDNHGLLAVRGQPQWRTVVGGSKEYVRRLAEPFRGSVRAGRAVSKVARRGSGVEVAAEGAPPERFDHVVLACHSDQALRMVDEPSRVERDVLGAIGYRPNVAVLHGDESLMPRRRRAWSSWVFLAESLGAGAPRVCLSYWMNSLQPLETRRTMLVTLNPTRDPDPALVHAERTFEHPVFDAAAVAAQGRIGEMQGAGGIWYCGAWQGHGFHEDGLASAARVAEMIDPEAGEK